MDIHQKKLSQVPLLVVSCDRYSDLWKPFFTLFWKYWPDCPFPVFLGSNHVVYDDPRIRTIQIGKDRGWSSNLNRMLGLLDTEYVLLFLEDFLLEEPVISQRLFEAIALAIDHHVGCLRIYSILPPPRPLGSLPGIGYFAAGDEYRVTLQVSLWNVITLRKLLHPGMTPWQFELMGTQLSETFDEEFWGLYDPPIRYDHGIEKGKWKPKGLAICAEAGVNVDLSKREAYSDEEWKQYETCVPADSRLRHLRMDMINALRRGQRKNGVSLAISCLCYRPWALEIYGAMIVGLISPTCLNRLRQYYLNAKLKWLRFQQWRAAG
ncbi:MAG: hypothetical protein JXA82_16290 [Sedimentisphaerales bacterium]|nr:hypothetical protein [Sedimentisphaerales bacterium]